MNKSKQLPTEDSADKASRRPYSGHRQASGDIGDNPEPLNDCQASPESSIEDSNASISDQSSTYVSCVSTTPTLTQEKPFDQNTHKIDLDVGLNDTEQSDSKQTNLIVNYLPPYMSQDEVKALFSSVGEVESCKLVREKNTGESLGYAFVKFVKASQATKAVNRLNGLRLQNKTIKVSLARPSSESIKGANLYICGLPKRMTQSEIESLFGQYGKIITARILYDNRTGVSRGVAFIRFDQRHEAEQAIKNLNGYRPAVEYPDSKPAEPIIVKFANSPTVLKQENLSMALLKQAVQSNHLAKSIFGNTFGGMKNPDYLMSQFFGPAMMASTGALTSQGWCLFVSNLSPETEDSDLWQLFGPFGAVQSVKLSRDNWTNKCRGYAFVTMTNYEEANLAMQSLNGIMLGDRFIQVSFKTHAGFKMRNLKSFCPPMDDFLNSDYGNSSGSHGKNWKKPNANMMKHTPGSKSLLRNLAVTEEAGSQNEESRESISTCGEKN